MFDQVSNVKRKTNKLFDLCELNTAYISSMCVRVNAYQLCEEKIRECFLIFQLKYGWAEREVLFSVMLRKPITPIRIIIIIIIVTTSANTSTPNTPNTTGNTAATLATTTTTTNSTTINN